MAAVVVGAAAASAVSAGTDEATTGTTAKRFMSKVYGAMLGAVFGDALQIRTRVERESEYRLIFHQDVHRQRDGKRLVEGQVQLVCVNQAKALVPLPVSVLSRLYIDQAGEA